MKLKKPVKILIIAIVALIVAYFVFLLLLFYTPLWTFMPESIRWQVAKYKAEEGNIFSRAVLITEVLKRSKSSLADVIVDKDQDSGIRMDAINMLGMRAHYSGESFTQREIDALYWAAADEGNPIPIRKEALNNLRIGGVSNSEIVDLEIKIVGDPNADSDLKFIAVKALGEAKDPRVVDVLMEAIEDPDGLVSEMAAMSLAKVGGEKKVSELLKIATDEREDPLARDNAMTALEDMVLYNGLEISQAVEIFKPLLKNEHYRVRAAAANLLKIITEEEYEIEGPTEEEEQTYFFGE